MSAAELREAARLMRERAQAATPGPWLMATDGQSVMAAGPGVGGMVIVSDPSTDEADATHIASWHPAVALTVADWLDLEADLVEDPKNHAEPMPPALAVARAFLSLSPVVSP